MTTPDDAADQFRFRASIPVVFGDLDIRGHANNVSLLRALETARVEYFRHVGMGLPSDYECVVASVNVDFLASAEYPDVLVCGVRMRAIGNSSLRFAQRLWVTGADRTVAVSDVTMVHRAGEPRRPTRVPDDWRERIRAWESVAVEGL